VCVRRLSSTSWTWAASTWRRHPLPSPPRRATETRSIAATTRCRDRATAARRSDQVLTLCFDRSRRACRPRPQQPLRRRPQAAVTALMTSPPALKMPVRRGSSAWPGLSLACVRAIEFETAKPPVAQRASIKAAAAPRGETPPIASGNFSFGDAPESPQLFPAAKAPGGSLDGFMDADVSAPAAAAAPAPRAMPADAGDALLQVAATPDRISLTLPCRACRRS
jgi:hypothetical protein